jgi:hypothetical protein
MTTKKVYIEKWNNYIEECGCLIMTPNTELGLEVSEAIRKLQSLVVRVANDKGLK